MKKRKKITVIVLAAAAASAAFALLGAYSMFKTQIGAVNSIEKLCDNFYAMEYDGDYGFDTYLENGGGASDEEMAEYISTFLSHGFYKPNIEKGGFGCSTISASDADGNLIFGRNFDWENCTAMVVVTKPDNGYSSVSTSNIDFLGFGDGFLPEEIMNKMMSLAAVYVPLDGMNEKGLCVADLIIEDGTQTHQSTDKPDITTTAAIRMLLDKCADTDEAVAELKKYDMNSSAGMQHHLAISDVGGNSVVVEYIDNEMHVTDAKVVTNFYLSEGDHYGIGTEQSKIRYASLLDKLKESGGVMTNEEVKKAIEAVSKHNYPDDSETTEWSVVFSSKDKTAEYYRREDFDKAYKFALE